MKRRPPRCTSTNNHFPHPTVVRSGSKYRMESLCDVPVNFLSDVDTTGGNSGSPTLNAKGELVGLLFDGNYESLSAGWIFNPELTRSIHVDRKSTRLNSSH